MKVMNAGPIVDLYVGQCSDVQIAKILTDLARLHTDVAFAKRHIRPGRNLRP